MPTNTTNDDMMTPKFFQHDSETWRNSSPPMLQLSVPTHNIFLPCISVLKSFEFSVTAIVSSLDIITITNITLMKWWDEYNLRDHFHSLSLTDPDFRNENILNRYYYLPDVELENTVELDNANTNKQRNLHLLNIIQMI